MKYHKIESVFMRNEKQKRYLLDGEWAIPEFELLQHIEWNWFEKIDGTNIRIYWTPETEEVRFEGREENSQIPATLVNWLNNQFLVSEILKKELPELPCVLYGEGYGNGIQKVGKLYNPLGVSFILFDVMVLGTGNGDIFLERENVESIAGKLGIAVVPFVRKGTIDQAIELVREGFTSALGYENEVPAEGLVGHPIPELFDRLGNRIITKIKTRDFPKE